MHCIVALSLRVSATRGEKAVKNRTRRRQGAKEDTLCARRDMVEFTHGTANNGYIETSVVSCMAADLSENIRVAGRQLATREMWQGLSNCRVFVSAAVVEEASAGAKVQAEKRLGLLRGFVVLEVDGQTQLLAARLLERKAIPAHCPEVAVHIACAAVNQVDFLLTWNFKHINNCLLYTSPSPRDRTRSRMPSSA